MFAIVGRYCLAGSMAAVACGGRISSQVVAPVPIGRAEPALADFPRKPGRGRAPADAGWQQPFDLFRPRSRQTVIAVVIKMDMFVKSFLAADARHAVGSQKRGSIEKNQSGRGPFSGGLADDIVDARVGSGGQGVAITRHGKVPPGLCPIGKAQEALRPLVPRVRPAGIDFGGLREGQRGLVKLARLFRLASVRRKTGRTESVPWRSN